MRVHMSARSVTLTLVTSAVLAVAWLMPASSAGQAATGAIAWNMPRTPDGQPDIQGFWVSQGRRLATYNIEEAADATHVFLSGVQTDEASLVIDPPDGKIPYQPWARARRTDVLEHHTNLTKWEYVDPHTRCFLSGVPRMFYQGQ